LQALNPDKIIFACKNQLGNAFLWQYPKGKKWTATIAAHTTPQMKTAEFLRFLNLCSKNSAIAKPNALSPSSDIPFPGQAAALLADIPWTLSTQTQHFLDLFPVCMQPKQGVAKLMTGKVYGLNSWTLFLKPVNTG
jgi:hypothetical protein